MQKAILKILFFTCLTKLYLNILHQYSFWFKKQFVSVHQSPDKGATRLAKTKLA